MTMDEIDRVGRHAADVLTTEVTRRVDIEAALRRVHDQPPGTVIALDRAGAPHRRRAMLATSAVAATALLVAGGAALSRRDTSPRIGPSATVSVAPATTVPSSAPPSTAPSADPTLPTPSSEPTLDIQQADVTVDEHTPVLEGQVIFATGIANTHPWVGAVTPSGRIFIGQTVDGATFSEIVDGTLVATGIGFTGHLDGGLDERLYAIDDLASELMVWSQSSGGSWDVEQRLPIAANCSLDVQPDGVRCGDAVVPIQPAADASFVNWSDDMVVTAARGAGSTSWNIEFSSDILSFGDCQRASCRRSMRADGTAIAWTPILQFGDSLRADLVSLLQPDRDPATAWLDCGGDCQPFGSDGEFIYTLGYAEVGTPSIVVRRFAFTDIAAGQSSTDPAVDALASWPAAPAYAPTLDDVPMLLPPLSGGVRTEYADEPATFHDFVQTWIGEGPDAPTLMITTNIDQTSGQTGESVDVGPWDHAVFVPTSPADTTLILDDPSGSVTVWSQGVTRDDLLAVARSLHAPTGDLPGWGVGQPPAGLTYVEEGWALGAASRSVQWTGADTGHFEMWISHGVPGTFTTPLMGEAETHVIDIGGDVTVTYELADGRNAVVRRDWSQEVTVMLASSGDPDGIDHLIELARNTRPVDETTWRSATTPDTSGADGCSSLFC